MSAGPLAPLIGRYEAQLARSLVLHAGRSVISPQARALLGSHLVDGDLAGRSHEWGAPPIAEPAAAIEALARALTGRLFGSPHIELRALTGSLANGLATVSLTKPGDAILMPPEWAFGHKSLGADGYPGQSGRRVIEMPWDGAGLAPDLEGLRRLLRAERPRLVILGLSRTLFPEPLAEVAALAREVGARLLYDGAHVFGLVAGGAFPNPLALGFDVLTGSTHKTLPGPTGGAVVCRHAADLEALGTLGDAWLSTYGNARVAALTQTLLEMVQHGAVYAHRVVDNARMLGAALAGEGFTVVGAARGFTATHQVIVDATGLATRDALTARLGAAMIMVNPPARVDRRLRDGRDEGLWLRVGTAAVTRVGMGADEMQQIARLLRRLLRDGEAPESVAAAVEALATSFREVQFV